MRRLLVILLIASCIPAFAQEEQKKNSEIQTLFGGDMAAGFYGSFDMKVSSFAGNSGLMTGGKGGWIIDHKFVIGGGGFGLSTNPRYNLSSLQNQDSFAGLKLGYGGLLLEYILWPVKPVHIAFPLLIAAGEVNVSESENSYYSGFYNGNLLERSSVFIVEPGVDLELNLLKFFRFGVGLSYRYAYGTNLVNFSDNDLSNLSMNFIFKFGYF